MNDTDQSQPIRYIQPDWFTQHVFNPMVRNLTRLGISVRGSRELRVRGRKTGEWRSIPVNLLTIDGQDYLVAPRGTTQWVRNLRVAGEGQLRLGRRVETFHPTELPDDAKMEVLRAYLKRWKSEVGKFFEGLDPDASDDEVAKVAPGFPVFKIDRV